MVEHLNVQETIKIPKERIAVLIGKNGEVKKLFERKSGLKMRIDSREGEVALIGESTRVFEYKEIVNAVARGFAPETAFKLFKEGYCFELVEIRGFGKTKSRMKILRGRVVGTKGKARRNIEEMTGCDIVVFGRTIGIIGQAKDVAIAKEAIEKLLSGAPHGHVYKGIDRKMDRQEKGNLNYEREDYEREE